MVWNKKKWRETKRKVAIWYGQKDKKYKKDKKDKKDSVKKWCETKRNNVKQKEMTRNKKKWRETKRNDEKQKEMTRNKKKWREAISHDVSPVAMFYINALVIYFKRWCNSSAVKIISHSGIDSTLRFWSQVCISIKMLRLQIIKFQGGCQGLLDLSQHDVTLGKLTNVIYFSCAQDIFYPCFLE